MTLENISPILPILTTPRSGTWWHLYFFHFYHTFLTDGVKEQKPMDYKTVFDYRASIHHFFMVQHSICPGFMQRPWPVKKDWYSLRFSIPGYDGMHAAMSLDPGGPEQPKILYVFRNPLDQFVSMFRHGQNHTSDTVRTIVDGEGNVINIDSPFKFAMEHGIQCYIKQYLTFKHMNMLFPDTVIMRSYENATRDPVAHFQDIFNIFNVPVDQAAFDHAMSASRKDNMSKMEDKLGHAIGNDQIDPQSRHIRDGSIGQWKTHFSSEQIKIIEKAFAAFDLSLQDFDLE